MSVPPMGLCVGLNVGTLVSRGRVCMGTVGRTWVGRGRVCMGTVGRTVSTNVGTWVGRSWVGNVNTYVGWVGTVCVATVGLNVGRWVSTSGVMIVLTPVGKNVVGVIVGCPVAPGNVLTGRVHVAAPVPGEIELGKANVGKNDGLKVGSRVPTPVPGPTTLGRIVGKPVNLNVGATEGNRVPVALKRGWTPE